MITFVVDINGKPLMPTYNIKKVRKQLKAGRVRIFCHEPFTIQLLYELPKQDAPYVQEVEFCVDTGDKKFGVSVKSEKHEFVHEEYAHLPDEKQRRDQRRQYRRTRRNRLRYRKPGFNKDTKGEGWIAPSLNNKEENHLNIYKKYKKVCPIKNDIPEVGNFDTQALEAQQAGKPLPEGTDYQHGPRYEIDTLREAVLYKDNHTCQICGKSPFDEKNNKEHKKIILCVHHALYWKGDHTDRLSGLMTVCTDCHTHANHQKGGKLWGKEPKVKSMSGAAFMNIVRWKIYEAFKEICEPDGVNVHLTYGVSTKRERHSRRIPKTHANDAYCMGKFRPKHKAHPVYYSKRRRNERVLTKFYDAKYVDTRDGKTKKASELGCNRTNRREPRNSDKNLRPFRGKKVNNGRVSIKKQRAMIPAGSIVEYKGKKYTTKGMHNKNTRCILDTDSKKQVSVPVNKLKIIHHASGWIKERR